MSKVTKDSGMKTISTWVFFPLLESACHYIRAHYYSQYFPFN